MLIYNNCLIALRSQHLKPGKFVTSWTESKCSDNALSLAAHGLRCPEEPWAGVQMRTAFLEDDQAGAIKIQNGMPFDPTAPLLGMSPREIPTQM